MSSTETRDQSKHLCYLLTGWLEAIDEALSETDTPLPERPFQALLRLMTQAAVEIRIGSQRVSFDRPWDHVAKPWFRALYVAVERWYQKNYGAESIRGKGAPHLEGVVLIRSVPFALRVPAHRIKPDKIGRKAWMYFERDIGEDEDPVRWLKNAPDLSTLDSERREEVELSVTKVAATLRLIHFHRMGVNQNQAAEGLADVAKGYLQSAARRIRAVKPDERGPAWFDLQMAMESALKLVLLSATGTYPHTHLLSDLATRASAHGVLFDPDRMKSWPDFKTMSGFRYAQGQTGGLPRLFEAYLLALDLVAAAMATVKTPLNSGAGILLSRPAWLLDTDDGDDDDPDDSSADEKANDNDGER